MKIGNPNKISSDFKVNGRRIVMCRNGVNGAARPIKNCSRQDVYEAMANIYDEFYSKEIDTDKMIPIEWLKYHVMSRKDLTFDKLELIWSLIKDWEKENEQNKENTSQID